MKAFRTKGKFAVAFAETFGEAGDGNTHYYLATAFEVDPAWPVRSEETPWGAVAGVAVDERDNVYVFTRSQLLDGVWGNDVFIDERTVDVHVGRLRKALTQSWQTDPIRTVRSAGYSFEAA